MQGRMASATVVCARRHVASAVADNNCAPQFEVLVGQSHVRNWYKSRAPDDVVLMKYGGEFKLPGGSLDEDVDCGSLRLCALRELREEFLIEDDVVNNQNFKVHLLHSNSTAAHGMNSSGNGFNMHHFVALDDENPWLRHADLEADAINVRLWQREVRHAKLIESGEFWELQGEERSRNSPEVHQAAWLPLPTLLNVLSGYSVVKLPSSKHSSNATVGLNEFQQVEFIKYGVQSRDPMWSTKHAVQCLEVPESCSSLSIEDQIRRQCKELYAYEQQGSYCGEPVTAKL